MNDFFTREGGPSSTSKGLLQDALTPLVVARSDISGVDDLQHGMDGGCSVEIESSDQVALGVGG